MPLAHTLDDTIVAISTPPGRGGIGVVRLSGPAARTIAETVLTFPAIPVWKPWMAALAELRDPDGRVVDQVVVTYFPGPRSYTAEDVIEISCHGAPVILGYCVQRACAAGARPAEPGEFTLRAFVRGRIDLPQAEAVRDLIEATTLYQARVAAQQVGGSVSRRLAPLKEQLVELVALLEAGIDFAEDDISVASDAELLRRLDRLQANVKQFADSFAYGQYVYRGFTLALVGRPNVGKSSLFNRLLDQDRAIVTDVPGTTRDLVSESMAIGGVPVRLVDTAGIRKGQDRVESLGIERSLQAMADADLTVLVGDGSAAWTLDDQELLEKAQQGGRWLLVANKSDLPLAQSWPESAWHVSAQTGEGIAALRQAILQAVAPAGQQEQQDGFLTSLRHERLLRECLDTLEQARLAVRERVPHEMLLLDLYGALRPLDAITGATTADDILNRIFATFCIGK